MKKWTAYIFWLTVTIVPIVGIVFGLLDGDQYTEVQSTWRTRIAYFGLFAPLAFVFLQALQVVVTPMSHYAFGILGGFLYGPYLGGLLNWLGRVIGHMAAYFIARYFARSIVERFVAHETLSAYDRYVSERTFLLFLLYFLPVFPDDELSYLAGLSKMQVRPFVVANVFGHVGGSLGLAYIGSGIDTRDTLFWVLLVATFTAATLLLLAHRRFARDRLA